jgi:alpha-tubulin suppressor-like RCC1 family protein
MKTKLLALFLFILSIGNALNGQINRRDSKSSNPYRSNCRLVSGGSGQVIMINNGMLWGWGTNNWGEVGGGTNSGTYTPILVDSSTNWATVACGENTTYGIKADGTLWAWGQNWYGQIGDSSLIDKYQPTKIGNDSDWISISGGWRHVLAIKADGTLWAWGSNNAGQLGDSSKINRAYPVKIGTATDWIYISAGNGNSFGIKSNGTLWAWGNNSVGEHGDGTTTSKIVPTQIGIETNWQSISTYDASTLAIKSDGSLWSWGYNPYGQVGDNTTTNRKTPIKLGDTSKWVYISAGYTSQAIRSDGTLWVWGYNYYGALGNGSQFDKKIPQQFGTDNDWLLVCGKLYTLGVKTNGELWISGVQVLNSTKNLTTSPNKLNTSLPSMWVDLSITSTHSVGIKSTGTMWSWGNNSDGQLGIGNTITKHSAQQIGTAKTWVNAVTGYDHSVGLTVDGSLYTWGNNSNGQLGDSTSNSNTNPIKIDSTKAWKSISAGYKFNVGIKVDGTLWAWGLNDYGQLGSGSSTDKIIPTKIGTDSTWVSAVCGRSHVLALKTNGTLWAWGLNDQGQLGDGSTTNSISPIQIGTLRTWTNIACGDKHSIALKVDGTLWTWGDNSFGQLGDGTTTNSNTPIKVNNDNNWIGIGAGAYHSEAIKVNGTLWMWGNNNQGQLGDATTTSRNIPTKINNQTDVVAAKGGRQYSAAIKADRIQICMTGNNTYGQQGDGGNYNRISFGCGFVANTPSIAINPIGSLALCAGDSFTVSFAVADSFMIGNTFTVQLSDTSGSFVSPINIGTLSSRVGGSIVATMPVNPFTASKYKVRVVSSPPTAISNFSANFTIYAIPKPEFSINKSEQCFTGHNYQFVDSTRISLGKYTTAWNFGDGDTSTQKNPTKTYNAARIWPVTLVANNNGCKDSITKNITVSPNPNAGFIANTTQSCFKGNTFLFTDTSKIDTGTYTINWNFGDGDTASGSQPSKAYSKTGTYNITLKLESDKGCLDSASSLVTVNPNPKATLVVNDSVACINTNNFVFKDFSSIPFGSLTRVWVFGDGDSSTNIQANKTYTSPNTWQVKLIAISDKGCVDSIAKQIIVNPQPQVSVLATKTKICNGDTASIQATLGTGYVYQWQKNTTDISNATSPSYTVNTAGNYKVKVTNAFGCYDTSNTINIIVNPLPVISKKPTNKAVNSGNSIIFTVAASNTNSTYQWQQDTGTGFNNLSNSTTFAGVTNDTLTITTNPLLNNANYRCEVTLDGCSVISGVASLTVYVGINKITPNYTLQLYPNPVETKFTITATSLVFPITYNITNVLGEVVATGSLTNETTVIPFNGFANGVYFFTVSNQSVKFIK